MSWKKIIIGEKVPERDDPAYREKWEQAESAGRSFAEALRLDKAAAFVQGFASRHTKVFLALVFGFVLVSISLNLYRMFTAVSRRYEPASAIERQEKELRMERHHQKNSSVLLQIPHEYITQKAMEEYETHGKD